MNVRIVSISVILIVWLCGCGGSSPNQSTEVIYSVSVSMIHPLKSLPLGDKKAELPPLITGYGDSLYTITETPPVMRVMDTALNHHRSISLKDQSIKEVWELVKTERNYLFAESDKITYQYIDEEHLFSNKIPIRYNLPIRMDLCSGVVYHHKFKDKEFPVMRVDSTGKEVGGIGKWNQLDNLSYPFGSIRHVKLMGENILVIGAFLPFVELWSPENQLVAQFDLLQIPQTALFYDIEGLKERLPKFLVTDINVENDHLYLLYTTTLIHGSRTSYVLDFMVDKDIAIDRIFQIEKAYSRFCVMKGKLYLIDYDNNIDMYNIDS